MVIGAGYDHVAPGRDTPGRNEIREQGLQVLAWFDSAITGGDGNREFFVHAKKS